VLGLVRAVLPRIPFEFDLDITKCTHGICTAEDADQPDKAQANGLEILLARPASSQAWGHQAHLPRSATVAEASSSSVAREP
jgi:hypothetical protein